MPAPSKQPPRDRLELSRLDNRAFRSAIMTEDIDLHSLLLYFRSELKLDAVERVIDATVSMTIEGAPTLVIQLNDYDRAMLRSGLLSNKLDLQIDGIWFRLVQVSKDVGGDELSLTFELREIAVLREYNSKKIAHRSKVTRAEFILNLIKEPVEFGGGIPFVIPDLHKVQPIEKSSQAPDWGQQAEGKMLGIPDDIASSSPSAFYGGGLPSQNRASAPTQQRQRVVAAQASLNVKGVGASDEQIKNANTILSVGSSMGARRKVLVVSIMVAIQESTLINLPGGDRDSAGLFQQRASWGSYQDRTDPATSARLFFERAIPKDQSEPTVPYWTIAQDVQHSAFPEAYQQWRDEAERFVFAFGLPGGDSTAGSDSPNSSKPADSVGGDPFIYYRGDPQDGGGKIIWKKEDSWAAIQRMADEVDRRSFFAPSVNTGARGMIFYYMDEDDLFKSKPIMSIGEFSEGVDGIGFDYDRNKKSATVNVTARLSKWSAPPGAIVTLRDVGPVNGRFLITTFERSLFKTSADITLKKPRPDLPEPRDNSFNVAGGWAIPQDSKTQENPDSPLFGDPPLPSDGTRNSIVKVALEAHSKEQQWHYKYPPDEGGDGTRPARPISDSLWTTEAHESMDCSAFATLVYKEAGAPDPNGPKYNYNGQGNTGSLIANARIVSLPEPGDLIFYGGNLSFPGHVGVYVGGVDVKGDPPPLFTQEGPSFYTAAFSHNSPFATAGPYVTTLLTADEQSFKRWVAESDVPFDVNASTVDYDMRGYWLNVIKPGGTWHKGDHFPDTYKTPYDTSFSKESQYATANNPFKWQGDKLVDTRDGSVVFWADYKPPSVHPKVVEIGSSKGVLLIDWDYRPVVAIGSYFPGKVT